MSKRLFDNHSCIFHAARTCERFDNTAKKVGWAELPNSEWGGLLNQALSSSDQRSQALDNHHQRSEANSRAWPSWVHRYFPLVDARYRWPVLSNAHRFSQPWLHRSQVCPGDDAGPCDKERERSSCERGLPSPRIEPGHRLAVLLPGAHCPCRHF